jgi:molybdopterin/thiamine biosynthesis adenylyltransferase
MVTYGHLGCQNAKVWHSECAMIAMLQEVLSIACLVECNLLVESPVVCGRLLFHQDRESFRNVRQWMQDADKTESNVTIWNTESSSFV